jgi:hypothetical protein
VEAERLGNGGACDIGVENSRFEAAAVKLNRGKASYERFTNAALAAYNADKLIYLAVLVNGCESRLFLCLAGAVCGASRAVMCAFCVCFYFYFIFLFFRHFYFLLWVSEMLFINYGFK